MATNKNNEFPVINNKKLHIAFKAFVTSFKESEENFLEQGVTIEDVKSLTKSFEDKAALTALSTILSVIAALPIKEFMAFNRTFKEVQKVKLLETFIEGVKPNGADNDIDN
jgi:hypothetical protein